MTDALHKTPLYDLHVELGARMVPFAGYAMPVQFPQGVMAEHLWTREKAGLFDVSHMGQARMTGAQPAQALERVTPGDIQGLEPGTQRYTLLLNEEGGILDDLMVSRPDDDGLFLVVNASEKHTDLAYIAEAAGADATLTALKDRALLALQGPMAAAVLGELAPWTTDLVFMQARRGDIAGLDCVVSRSGYTGEDGYEISVPADAAADFARKLLSDERVAPIGLGARDSLRLEAGLCLYGSDIDAGTTPVEADLKWAVAKVRRERADFPGGTQIMAQFAEPPARKRVGLRLQGRAPARAGAQIVDKSGAVIGRLTSGGFAPTLQAPIAMGYVAAEHAKPGTQLDILVRGKPLAADVVRPPFVPQRYYRG